MEGSNLGSIALAFSNAVLFVFTTATGWVILVCGAGILVFFRVSKKVADRKALLKSEVGQKLPSKEVALIVLEDVLSLAVKALANVPVLIATFAIIGSLVAVSAGVRAISDIAENQKRIGELTKVVMNLERRYLVADIEAVGQDAEGTDLVFRFYGGDETGRALSEQRVRVPGRDIYVDSVVFNFDYSDIGAGRRVNLALPYRVFSEKLAQYQGIALELKDEWGIPWLYKRDDETVYGLSLGDYIARLKELLALLEKPDSPQARLVGIRAVYGNAVHRIMSHGDKHQIWVEQTGGLSIKDTQGF
jgi:hypothetical protein